MKIAIMGIRGIPACYGGFETMAEEMSPRLVNKGHEVTVYGRKKIIEYHKPYYKGVKIKLLPSIKHKYLDTVSHTFLSVIHSFFQGYDVILICCAANSIFSFLPRLVGIKVAVNVDGIERKREKWNWLGKIWHLMGEFFSVLFPNKMVSDAKVIQEYYQRRYHKDSVLIPYGAFVKKKLSLKTLNQYGIQPDEYFLFVSRLEPENNAHLVIKAFEEVKTNKKLVIVGDAPYSKNYISSLKKTKDKRVVFTGYVFGEGYEEFQSHAYSYIHATEVGGTHPALIEAMGFGNCIIANGTPENIEVLGDCGLIYQKNSIEDLRKKMQYLCDNKNLLPEFGKKAQERSKKEFDWESITAKYEKLFLNILE